MSYYIAPLHIYIARSKSFASGAELFEGLFHWFNGNEGTFAVPQANIPVLNWTNSSYTLPPDIPWDEAERSALVILADDSLCADVAWRDWVNRQWSRRRRGDLLLPCAFTRDFMNVGPAFETTNAIRLYRVPNDERAQDLALYATHSVARWYVDTASEAKPVRLFISHAKSGRGVVRGRDLALALKAFVESRPTGQVFFDEVGIAGGDEFVKTLNRNLKDSVVLVILTDNFSSRYWCGWEALTAKQKNRPLVVVNALEQGEASSLAYIGKTPTIRWNVHADGEVSNVHLHRRIVACALMEHLRIAHDYQSLDAIRKIQFSGRSDVAIAMRPPELTTLPDRVPGLALSVLLHADPPLPRYEVQLIKRHRPDLTLVSAAQALAGGLTADSPLAGKRIAISISDTPNREARGMSKGAQERLWTRLATHLLAAGAQLAYGGDLRQRGYTDQLIDLAQSTADAGQAFPAKVIHWYVGWPVSAQLSVEDKARLPTSFEPHFGEVPSSIAATTVPTWPSNDLVPEHHYAWTLGMSEMRNAMASSCHARVLVGGQYQGLSPWPGLLEEFETFIGKPIYLLGAFGGCATLLIDVLHGKSPEVFSEAYQDQGGARTHLRKYYEKMAGVINWPSRIAKIQALGIAILNNGLTKDDNERLFTTRNSTEMIALILKGLRNIL